MVRICPSHSLAICLLVRDDWDAHLSADNPPARKSMIPSCCLFLFSLFLQHSHKSPGEHLHSKQHEMNVDLAKQHWKLVIYMSCTSRNNLLNEDAACLTPKVGPDLFNWYPGSFCSVAKDSFLCRAAEFSCVCAAFWTSIFFSCGYRKPERQSGSLLKHKLSFSPTADYVHVLSDPSDAIDLKTKYFIFYFK